MAKLLTKEKAGWFGTPYDKMAFKIDESLVTLAVKPLCSDKYEMVSVPKEVILELAERIKSKEISKKDTKEVLRVWWSSQVPISGSLETYPVENIEQAKAKINELTQRDLKDSSVTDNVGGLEFQFGGEWFEWSDEESGDDITQIMDSEGSN